MWLFLVTSTENGWESVALENINQLNCFNQVCDHLKKSVNQTNQKFYISVLL